MKNGFQFGSGGARSVVHTIASATKRVPFRSLALAMAVLGAGCSPPPDQDREELGSARIALSQAPADAQCLQVSAHGSRSVTQRFTLIAGAGATLEMAGLPLGAAEFRGQAFSDPCANPISAEPTWVSDPALANLVKGEIAQVALTMHRNGRAAISVGFCDADVKVDVANCGACDNACPAGPFATAICTDGVCGLACEPRRANCDGDVTNGCESGLDFDPANCGACGAACGSGQICRSGVCATPGKAITAGSNHSCAIVNGGARCWGSDFYGELGDNNPVTIKNAPVQVKGLTAGVTDVAAGRLHTCAVVGGGVLCWGMNIPGGLNTPFPSQLRELSSDVVTIAAGNDHTCAVVGGAARCWGSNVSGELGDGSTIASTIPVQVLGLTAGVSAVAAGGVAFYGGDRSCAIVDGGARCWGSNLSGALGNDSITDSAVPVQVSGLLSGVTAIAVGVGHTCAIVNGGVRCWGDDGVSFASLVPVPIPGLDSGVTDLAAGYQLTCAVVRGAVQCFGMNDFGELGNGSTTSSSEPVQVQGLTSGATAVAIGSDASLNHVCAMIDGRAQCWGRNVYGQLGDGTATDSNVPVIVKDLPPPPCGQCAIGAEACDQKTLGPIFCITGTDGCGHWGPPPSFPSDCVGVTPLGGGIICNPGYSPSYCTWDGAGCRVSRNCPDGMICAAGFHQAGSCTVWPPAP